MHVVFGTPLQASDSGIWFCLVSVFGPENNRRVCPRPSATWACYYHSIILMTSCNLSHYCFTPMKSNVSVNWMRMKYLVIPVEKSTMNYIYTFIMMEKEYILHIISDREKKIAQSTNDIAYHFFVSIDNAFTTASLCNPTMRFRSKWSTALTVSIMMNQ